jgi:chromosome partitioning protein
MLCLMTGPIQHRATSITVLNLKGGVGKTHAVWLFAAVCQERRSRVLVIDLDPQANLTGSFVAPGETQPGVEVLVNPAADHDPHALVRRTAFDHIDIIPAGPALARYDLADQQEWERADLHLSLVDAVASLRPHYDFIVFDCPPRLSLLSFAALCAADGVLIPLEAADWGAQGIVKVAAAIEYVQRRFNADLMLLGYLVSRFKKARAYQRGYISQLRKHFGHHAFDTVIPDLARFEKSVTDRVPITLFAPGSVEAGIARRFFAEVRRRAERVRRSGSASGRSDIHAGAVAAA